ncbi:MAG: phosphatidate cytidylyltransferase [Planctomycetota bacterium]|nr:MAG: phosphatidate cytidylyltransferase [Planctomycetota bacterium]
MLKHRLVFGTLMTLFFTAVVIFDSWLDGSLTASVADDKHLQATILCILIALLVIPANLELAKLATAKNLKIFTPLSTVLSILFATAWYWPQLIEISPRFYISFLSAFSLLALLLYQYIRYGNQAILVNCGVNFFSIVYLGLLSSFCVALRIDFGPWPLLMFIFAVKAADIGAYTFGKLFGKHKFAPIISPGKTWEGMVGAIVTATIVAILLATMCGIMVWQLALIFGCCSAFIGQIGDLVESMIKRDAQQKDSANNVPGFGGVLDVVDSPLFAAPFAYLFFMLSSQ